MLSAKGRNPFQRTWILTVEATMEYRKFSVGNSNPDLSVFSCLVAANDADHSRMRRLLSHAFSEAALREQEPLFNSYFDLLIQKLYEKVRAPENGKVNMIRWFNFTTFDLIGDLVSRFPGTHTVSDVSLVFRSLNML
jgi:cytochrome P450